MATTNQYSDKGTTVNPGEPKKATTLTQLLKDITELLQPIERLAEMKKNPIRYTVQPKITENKLLLQFKTKSGYWTALEWLEAGYADYIEIFPEEKDTFSFSIALREIGMPVPERTNRDLALGFIKKFRQHVRQLNPKVAILTPYLTLANNAIDPLVMEFPDAGDAAEAAHLLNWNFDVTREKKTVTCKISRDERLYFSLKNIDLPADVKMTAKGLVTVGENKGRIPYDPRMPATFLIDDYKLANYLEFNRKYIPKHIVELRMSMRIWGVITFCVMAETDCIDGNMKLYVVDGQNRAKACEYEGYPIIFTKVRVQTKRELVELMVMLNNTNKGWSNDNYLWTWAYLQMPPYTVVKEKVKESTVPLSALLPIYQWTINAKGAMKHFRKGEMVFPKQEMSEECIGYLENLKKELKKKKIKFGRDYTLGFYLFFKQTKDAELPYDNAVMMQKIAAANGNMSFSVKDTTANIAARFQKLYSEN